MRERFTGAEMEVPPSPSELSSGAARFLPLGSLTGSLMVRGTEMGWCAERRGLQRGTDCETCPIEAGRVHAPLAWSGRLVYFLALALGVGRLSGSFGEGG